MDQLRRLPFLIALILLILAFMVEAGGIGLRLGIGALMIFDILLLGTVALVAMPLITGNAFVGRVQGVITLVMGLLVALLSLYGLFAVISLLMVMLMALSFVIPYGLLFAFFPTGKTTALLGLLLLLKLGFGLALVLAHQRFLENRGLVIIILTSVGLTFLTQILHSFPAVVVSLTDAVAAIIILIVALIRAIGFAIGGFLSLRKAVG